MFTAVASKELLEKHFRRKISANAKGVTLIKDGKKAVYYDVSETESLIENEIKVKLWTYDDSAHKKFIDATCAAFIKDQDISLILTETQATARIFLDSMQKAIVQPEVENANNARIIRC